MRVDAPPSASLGALAQPTTRTDTSAIASDFDTFLTLLTAQLRNQDPLNPMDATQFTQQLTQLSQLEQTAAQTESLEGISGSLNGLVARVDAGFLGQRIETETNAIALVDGEAAIDFVLPTAADGVQVEITDASGRLVAVVSGDGAAGAQRLSWGGRASDGTLLPDGAYGASVRAVTGETTNLVPLLAAGVVEEVRFTPEGAYARLDSGAWTPLANARAVGG